MTEYVEKYVNIVNENDEIINKMSEIASDKVKDGLRGASVVFVLNSRKRPKR